MHTDQVAQSDSLPDLHLPELKIQPRAQGQIFKLGTQGNFQG